MPALDNGMQSGMINRLAWWVLLLPLLSGCGTESSWEGVVYPDGSDLTEFRSIGTFSSFDECKSAAIEELKRIGAQDTGDWECGTN